ncbi:MAG: hypothetical protein E7317_07250 [Clostridiales bacterium]|nr:hypothetical protein [Clostridiales bacterium]
MKRLLALLLCALLSAGVPAMAEGAELSFPEALLGFALGLDPAEADIVGSLHTPDGAYAATLRQFGGITEIALSGPGTPSPDGEIRDIAEDLCTLQLSSDSVALATPYGTYALDLEPLRALMQGNAALPSAPDTLDQDLEALWELALQDIVMPAVTSVSLYRGLRLHVCFTEEELYANMDTFVTHALDSEAFAHIEPYIASLMPETDGASLREGWAALRENGGLYRLALRSGLPATGLQVDADLTFSSFTEGWTEAAGAGRLSAYGVQTSFALEFKGTSDGLSLTFDADRRDYSYAMSQMPQSIHVDLTADQHELSGYMAMGDTEITLDAQLEAQAIRADMEARVQGEPVGALHLDVSAADAYWGAFTATLDETDYMRDEPVATRIAALDVHGDPSGISARLSFLDTAFKLRVGYGMYYTRMRLDMELPNDRGRTVDLWLFDQNRMRCEYSESYRSHTSTHMVWSASLYEDGLSVKGFDMLRSTTKSLDVRIEQDMDRTSFAFDYLDDTYARMRGFVWKDPALSFHAAREGNACNASLVYTDLQHGPVTYSCEAACTLTDDMAIEQAQGRYFAERRAVNPFAAQKEPMILTDTRFDYVPGKLTIDSDGAQITVERTVDTALERAYAITGPDIEAQLSLSLDPALDVFTAALTADAQAVAKARIEAVEKTPIAPIDLTDAVIIGPSMLFE